MTTCKEYAQERLASKPLRPSTLVQYFNTLNALGLSDMPYDEVNANVVTARLNGILNQNSRRKHAIAIQSSLGIKTTWPKAVRKDYDLPDFPALHAALDCHSFRMWGMVMLYGGLRLGEACISQPIKGNVITVDRQRMANGTTSIAKTAGPVTLPDWLADEYKGFDFDRGHITVYKGIQRAGRKQGLVINPHMLRHAFATNLVRLGCPPNVLQAQMRHSKLDTTMKYYVQTSQADVSYFANLLGSAPTNQEGGHSG